MTDMKDAKFDQTRRAIVAAVRNHDLAESEGGQELALLSTNTQFDSIEVFDDEIAIVGNEFSGPIIWHVQLVYRDPEGDIQQSDSFPGQVSGRLEGDRVVIVKLSADTRSFYQ
jgi:hypothetical protein